MSHVPRPSPIELPPSSLVPPAAEVAPSFDGRFPLQDPKRIASDYRLIWLGTGTEDVFYKGAKAFVARLTANGVRALRVVV